MNRALVRSTHSLYIVLHYRTFTDKYKQKNTKKLNADINLSDLKQDFLRQTASQFEGS